MIKTEHSPATILITVKITMGIGKLISATIGASITIERLNMLEMPIDVTAKSVGNIFGC